MQAGSIVLFHNAALHTPEALPRILEYLINDGYTVLPISQLILTGDYTFSPAPPTASTVFWCAAGEGVPLPFHSGGPASERRWPAAPSKYVKAIPVRNGLDIMVPTLPMGGACKMYAL